MLGGIESICINTVIDGVFHGIPITSDNRHYQQYLELAFIGFIILYLGWWAFNLIKGQKGDEAYMNIPFEKEAYANDDNPVYLLNRKRYAWIRYISS